MQSIKSIFYLLPLLFLTLVGCSQKKPLAPLDGCPYINPLSLNSEILKYQELVEETLSVRKITINYMQDFNNSKPLTGQNIDDIRRFTKKHLILRERFDYYLDGYACLMNKDNSSNLEPKNRLKGGMIALSSALLLYDNYRLALSLYEKNKRLRRLINSEDMGYELGKNSLAKVTESYTSDENRRKMISEIAYYKKNIKKLKNTDNDIYFSYLKKLINQSISYQKSKNLGEKFWFKIKMLKHHVRDDFHALWDMTLNLFSKIFGNSVGLVETRKGKLYNNKTILTHINSKIKSGDILLEKTPFRLTDSLIPGYWGHVAIYTGTVEELKKLGIWEHPVVQKYHQHIKKKNMWLRHCEMVYKLTV